jgi:glycosyltransferase involved in cell wall biosynthesis
MAATVSVIVTVLNEAKHLPDLLDSLAVQEAPTEVLIVDAGSHDGSVDIVEAFARDHPQVRLLHHPGKRGESRNAGAAAATGDYLAFIDGDCIANPFWLRRARERADPQTVVAGRTVLFGYWAFEKLQRVELPHRGHDVTFPSSNLLYPREAFLRLGGFDPRFVTAEDIDLNLRAVESGLRIVHEPRAVVYHRARDSVVGFLRQAFWNGYGRKQLTLKHGKLWKHYSFERLIRQELHFWGFLRVTAAVLGYARCRLRESHLDWREATAPRLAAREVHA